MNEPCLSRWMEFHEKNCKLRWLSKAGNKKISNKAI